MYSTLTMLHKIRQWVIKFRNKRRVGDFSKFVFPIIKNMPKVDLRDTLVSVQPMVYPTKPYFTEYYDLSNPRIGQIFRDGNKNKDCDFPQMCSCIVEMWQKIWTPEGWICEKTDAKAFAEAVEKYAHIYKAELAIERETWDKEHGITKDDFHISMAFVFDSKKPNS